MESALGCVERTFEYMDGLVFVAMLRARNIEAHLFDENFVRQDWFYILVYGGFRIMVPSKDLQIAQETLAEFRCGVLLCDEDEMSWPACPACHAHGGEFDPRPRRWVFLAYIVGQIVLAALLLLDSGWIPYFVLNSVFSLATLMPCLLRLSVNNRLRCSECAHAWRELPLVPFAQQQRNAENALAMPPS